MKSYRTNWLLQGLKGLALEIGAVVKLEAEEAKEFVEIGVLSLCEGESEAEDTQGSTTAQGVDLSGMTKAQLVEYAQALGLSLDINKTQKNLLAAIADAAAK